MSDASPRHVSRARRTPFGNALPAVLLRACLSVRPSLTVITCGCTVVAFLAGAGWARIGAPRSARPGSPPGADAASLPAAARAARALIQRVLPKRASAFSVEIIPAQDGADVFEIESVGDTVVLRGNSGVAVASALNWYLKYHCQRQLS